MEEEMKETRWEDDKGKEDGDDDAEKMEIEGK